MKLHFLCVLILSIFSYANGQFRFQAVTVEISDADIFTQTECQALATNDVMNAYNTYQKTIYTDAVDWTSISFFNAEIYADAQADNYYANTYSGRYLKGCNIEANTNNDPPGLRIVWWDDAKGVTASYVQVGDISTGYTYAFRAVIKKPSVAYSSLDGVGTSWKLRDSSGTTLADSDLVSCDSDGNFIDDSDNQLSAACEEGYSTEDYWYWLVNPTTAYSCNSSLHVIVAESGFCQKAGCKDSDATNYDSTVVYKDLIIVDDVRYDSCQYTDCAAYQTSKVTGVCLVNNRPEFDGNTNNVKTSGCSAGATTCSHVSAVTDKEGVKINGDNDAYCLQGELVDGSAATATQTCDTANYYFKDGDSANSDGSISGYTCSGTTVSEPSGVNYDGVQRNSAQPPVPSYSSTDLKDIALMNAISQWYKDGDHWDKNQNGACEDLLAAMKTAADPVDSSSVTDTTKINDALSKFQEITGFDLGAAENIKAFNHYSMGYSSTGPKGCSVKLSPRLDGGWTMSLEVNRGTNYWCDRITSQGVKYYCVDISIPSKCEAKSAGVTAAMIAATTLNGFETCETGSQDFENVACKTYGGYATVNGEPAGYGCNNGTVEVTNECVAKCSDTLVTGYAGTPNNLFVATFDGSGVSCADKFHGVASAGVCSGAGAQPEYSGCDADTCTNTLPDGYAFDGTPVLEKHHLDVSLSCTNTHLNALTFEASCPVSGHELAGDLSFTAVGDTDYTVAGYTGGDPQLKVCKGETYNILRTEAGHALQIRRKFTTLALLAADATSSSSQSWTPADTDTYQYYCVMHAAMMGEIEVVDCGLEVAGCLPKATFDPLVSAGTLLQSGGTTVNSDSLVCHGSDVKYQTGEGTSDVVEVVCKNEYGSTNSPAVQCDSSNKIVNSGNLCVPKCNEPGSDAVTGVTSGANTKTVSLSKCDGGNAAVIDNQFRPAGCFQEDGAWKFNEYKDSDGNPSVMPCENNFQCKQYANIGYVYDATATSTLKDSVSLTGFSCGYGYTGNPVATCPGAGEDLVFTGCSKAPDCSVSSNALLSECMCGSEQCEVGKYCDVDGCKDYRSCPSNFYNALREFHLTSPSDDVYQYRTDGGLGDFSVTEQECQTLAGDIAFQVLQADSDGKNSEPTGCGYWENGDGTIKVYRYNYYPSSTYACGTNIGGHPVQCVSKPQASCQCGGDVAVEGEYCALNSNGDREKSTATPCSAGAGSNSESCFCPSSSSNPRLGVGVTCNPTADDDVYCYDSSEDQSGMTCSFDALNKPDDFMLEDPGETSTTDLETWLIAHAKCGEGKFQNVKRQTSLDFECIPCDRTAFLNNYNTPYGVKATNVDGKDVLKREPSLDDHKNVVHGMCCVNAHHSVCAQMIKEYKSKCESTLVMTNGVIQDEVSKGKGVQCLASDDVDGDYDCVLGPGDAVCQNGGTPTGKMVSTGCTCTCPSGYSGPHCEVNDNAPAPTCANDVAISDTCSCQGADRTDGVCKNSGANYHPLCVNGATLASMAGDTCACWDGVAGTSPDIAYKNDANADTLTCTNGNIA